MAGPLLNILFSGVHSQRLLKRTGRGSGASGRVAPAGELRAKC